MARSVSGALTLLVLSALLSQAGQFGSVAAYGIAAGTAGVLSLRLPERHSKSIGLACFVFVGAHVVRAFFGPSAYEGVLSFGYVFIAYATFKIFRRSNTRSIDWSLILEAGAIGVALTTVLLFNPYFEVPSAKMIIIALSTAGVLFILMSELGRRTVPIVKMYLAAIVVSTWMEAFDQFFSEEYFSALWTAPYYPLVAGLLLPEADRRLAASHVPSRRRFGVPQLVLFGSTIVSSSVVAYLGETMPLLWALLAGLATALIFVRIWLLILQRDWSFAQEHELRQFGEGLIPLTSTQEIDEVTLRSLQNLGGRIRRVAILDVDPNGEATTVAASDVAPRTSVARGQPTRLGVAEPSIDGWFDPAMRGGFQLAVRVPATGESGAQRWFVCEADGPINPEVEDHYQAAAAQYSLAVRAQELAVQVHEQNARLAAEQARREAQEAWQALTVGSQEVALRVHDGIVTATTPHPDQILGLDPLDHRLEDLRFLDSQHVDGGSFENPQQPGQWLKVAVQVGADGSAVFTIRDVTAEIVDAVTDSITGFSTLGMLEATDQNPTAVLPGTMLHLLDFGGLEKLRERLGRPVSDHALRVLAERTREAFRVGEDHFWRGEGNQIYVSTTTPLDDERLEERRRSIGGHITIEDHDAEPDLVIATIEIDHDLSAAATIQRLQIALNHGRREGVGTIRFTNELYAEVKRKWDLERAFKRALADPVHGGFTVHYQPLVSARPSARPVGVEALVRWNHPDFGAISPMEFIPVAERMGLIDAIDSFVLDHALRDIEVLQRIDPDLVVHVNLSPVGSLVAKLDKTRNAVILHGADKARSLVVEITESALGDDPQDELVDAAHRLRSAGIGLAVDDFGTGESNYDRITVLPFTELKLSRKFAQSADEVMVSSIVQNFHTLGLTVVAENVETAEQLRRMQEAGCDTIQGYFYHRPAVLETIAAWIQERTGLGDGDLSEPLMELRERTL